MFTQHQQILNGPALAMIEYIRNNNIGIDIQRLEALDKHIRINRDAVSPEFLIESRRVREELRAWFQDQPKQN